MLTTRNALRDTMHNAELLRNGRRQNIRADPLPGSQPMSQLSDNLTSRREELKMKVPDVHAALNRLGIDVAPSTVFGWFNGSRSVRNMDHLKALCAVLQSDLNTLAGDEIEIAEGKVETSVVRELRELSPTQREAVLALVRSMKVSA